MQHIQLEIEENRYPVLIQFLKTLDYVKIVQPEPQPGQAKKPSKKVKSKPATILFENYSLKIAPGETFRREEIYGDDSR